MSQNKLKIQAESLDLELSGDADYVRDAYAAIRPVVLQRFQSALQKAELPTPEDPPRKRQITQPLYKQPAIQKHIVTSRGIADQHLRLIVCGDLYHKVSVLSRPDFEKSIFNSSIDIDSVEHVFVNEGDIDLLETHFPIGRTLWRELTPTGKSMVQGNSS